MEQFRQRVSATCHIGPLDLEETGAYILHRLKCAGAGDSPHFEPAVFPAVYAASGGIPRRINSICDRLLLLGYMENRTLLTSVDVDTVLRDFAGEATPVAKRRAARPNGNAVGLHAGAGISSDIGVDLVLPPSLLEPDAGSEISLSLDSLDSQHLEGRLERLELGLMRLERISAQTVRTLQELVSALTKARDDSAP